MRTNNSVLEQTMERLSSGKRINAAKDDAAGLAIVTRMNSQIRGMQTATRNAQDGQSLLQTAESALGSISDILSRMRELAVQADNGTYSTTDKTSLQAEVADLIAEIDHIAQNTTFNGISLLNGTSTLVSLHISDKATDVIGVSLQNGTSGSLAVGTVNVSTGAQAAITAIDTALNTVSTSRANLGAKQNRLNFIIDNLQIAKQNTEASKSRIEDADMAQEASELTKRQILAQSSMSMLQQANQSKQSVLSLLQQ
jgi:flagellin